MVVMTPPRESWTDERLDDLKERMDEGFRDLKAELRQQREEMAQQRGDMGQMARQKEMDARFDAVDRTMQIGFGIIGCILTAMLGLLGLIATQL